MKIVKKSIFASFPSETLRKISQKSEDSIFRRRNQRKSRKNRKNLEKTPENGDFEANIT